MNKTVTINISGIIFHIEEDAYGSLSNYLSTIKGYFSTTEGGNEIMSDIEARIAELLQAKINATKQVVLMSDVEHVMDIMGKPEEFGAEAASNSQNDDFRTGQAEEKVKRRLFRNPDEKAIGGVCSGLAAYFDIDTVWVRLAMLLLFFFGGLSLWVYIILWMVIPLAKTTADKFAMRGESANVNNILRSFKEEAEDVKSRFDKYGREFRNHGYGERIRNNTSRVLNAIINVIGRLMGVFLLFLGCIFLFAYLTTLFGISVADSNTDFTKWKHVIFNSSPDYALGVFAFVIVCGIPVLMLLYGGIKLLFRISYRNRWLNLCLGILWTIGLLTGFYITANTVKQFSEHSRLKEDVVLHDAGDTLIIKMSPGLANLKDMKFDNEDDLETYMGRRHGGYYFGESGRQLSMIGHAGLNVVENTSDSMELVINRTAKGESKKEANENARSIHYSYHQKGNELIFDEVFWVTPGCKFRAQELDIKIKLPKGKVVYFDKSVKYLLDDVENTTNTWDGDMINKRWTMTDQGLKCMDCQDMDNLDDSKTEEVRSKHILINDRGIRVSGPETQIKIDENGIHIKTPENDVEVRDHHREKRNDSLSVSRSPRHQRQKRMD